MCQSSVLHFHSQMKQVIEALGIISLNMLNAAVNTWLLLLKAALKSRLLAQGGMSVPI